MEKSDFTYYADQELDNKIRETFESKHLKNAKISRGEALNKASNLIFHPEVAEYIKKKMKKLHYWFDWRKLHMYYFYDPDGLDHVILHDGLHGVSICTSSFLHSGLYYIDDDCKYRQWAWDGAIMFYCSNYSLALDFPIWHRDAKNTTIKYQMEAKHKPYFVPVSDVPIFPWADIIKPLKSNKLYYSMRWAKSMYDLKEKILGLSDFKIKIGKLYTAVRIDTKRTGYFLQKVISSKIRSITTCSFKIRIQSLIAMGKNVVNMLKEDIKKGNRPTVSLGELDVIPLKVSNTQKWLHSYPIDGVMLFIRCREYKSDMEKNYDEALVRVRQPHNKTKSLLKSSNEYVTKMLALCKEEIFINV